MDEDIKVVFIIPKVCGSERDCSGEMQLAFTACDQHRAGGLKAEWIKEASWKLFTGLTKKDVFVLQDFQGEFYDKLRATKCLIVGPRCLSCCLTEGVPIPSGPEPVYTVAMRGIVTTASGLTKAKKENIKKKVQQMGGIYSTVLTDETTHLVSDTVLSDKYIKSVEKCLPIMSESWVDAVWEASLHLNVNGASSDFNCHKLPAFANLQVTTSGISKRDKQMIMKLVNENGGNFSGAFQSESTDIVVLTKEGVGSEKYKAALEYGKACVLPTWVKDSAAMGVALPLARYRVAGASTSSPLAEHRLPDMSLNFSRITNIKPPNNFVDETRSADASTLSGKTKLSQETSTNKNDTSMDKEILAAFENFDMSSIKKAGPIFDGFCIWVSGLEGSCRERALACVSRCGGVRYDAAHARVTHAVAGSAAAAAAARAATAAPVLSAAWLPRSVLHGAPLPEGQFLFDVKPATPAKSSARKQRIEPASPLSKRNLQLLRRGPLNLPPPTPEVEEPAQDEIVNHYLSQPMPEPEPQRPKSPEPAVSNVTVRQPDATEVTQEPTEVVEQIFAGIKIEVQGLEEEAVCEVGAELAAAGGVLCAAGAGGTYVLVPLDFDLRDLVSAQAEAVTVFWLKDCLSQQELLPTQYYHRPVNLPQWTDVGPLAGVVASLSTYSGIERAFLDELAKLLGATTQLRFCRRNTSNALASTHLICPSPSGDKYVGAVKWGLPAVKASWLMQCAKEGRRVSEKEHLVGDTKAPPSPVKPVSEEPPPNVAVDKENKVLSPAVSSVSKRDSIPSRTEMLKNMNFDEDISPASRYIAMSRQGLLASQETKSVQDSKDDGDQVTPSSAKTAPREPADSGAINKENEMLPPAGTVVPKRGSIGSRDEMLRNKNLDCANLRTPPLEEALSSPNLAGLSPTIRRHLQAFKRGDIPSNAIRTPNNPFDNTIETPDSAFGAALKPGSGHLTPEKRKHLWKFVNGLPTKQDIEVEEKIQTPLSEIRNRFLAQYKMDTPTQPVEHQVAPRKLNLQDQAETPPAKMPKLSADQSAGGVSVGSGATEHGRNTSASCAANASCAVRNASAARDTSASSVSSAAGSSGVKDTSASSASSASSTLPPAVADQLQRLSAALSGRTPQRRRTRPSGTTPVAPPEPGPETEPGPESQPNTVGWDDTTPANEMPQVAPTPQKKKFMLSSNVDNCEEIAEMIAWLGGEVCEGPELDAGATHLLCAAPTRSEKILGSVAAGRWVLHPAYAARSRARGAFLAEEDYEWGNPRAACLPSLSNGERQLANAAYRWRSARASGRPGPFAGVTALLHVPAARRRLLARLVTAGDGLAPDLEPPYDNADVNVCFADVKRYPLSERDAAWLVSRRIPVCAPVLLSSYLTDDNPPKPEEHCLPEFRPK